VFLDVPRLTCLFRVILRWIRHIGRTRGDMPPDCPERVTWEFVAWIWSYPARRRPDVLARLAEFERRGGRAVTLRTPAESAAFLASTTVTDRRGSA